MSGRATVIHSVLSACHRPGAPTRQKTRPASGQPLAGVCVSLSAQSRGDLTEDIFHFFGLGPCGQWPAAMAGNAHVAHARDGQQLPHMLATSRVSLHINDELTISHQHISSKLHTVYDIIGTIDSHILSVSCHNA